MTYQVNDLGDGRFELVELRPIPLGVLTSRRIAERFADFLDQMDEESLRQLEAFTAEEPLPEPDLFVVDAAPIEIEPAAGPSVPTAPAPAGDETQPPEPAKELPLDEAFRRLEAGEKLGPVADDLGMDMNRLRAQWARRCRAVKEEAAAPPGADTEECRMCGREFHSSIESDGLCARCTRGLGGA